MKIVIGCDPNAQDFKEQLIPFIEGLGHEVTDFGSEDTIYANTAIRCGEAVAAGEFDRGVLICGTGIGISIAANKVKGVRAALCADSTTARMTRLHNDSNVLAMGAGIVGENLALDIVDTFMTTDFSGVERHQKRVDLIED